MPLRLQIDDLVVRRGDRPVLSGVSLALEVGEALGVLGPNGAGKTSLFHALIGLVAPQSGGLRLDGVEIPFGGAELRASIGVVFQAPALDPRLTARENLELFARLHGVPRIEASRRIEDLLTKGEILDRADEPVSRLSGGLRRRVEIARAVLHAPRVLILDEPTTGLDEAAFRRTWTDLDRLRREWGFSLLLTTHRPEEAERCDRLAILDGGRIVACDSPGHLKERLRGDLLVLEVDDPPVVHAALRDRLGVESRIVEGAVLLERERAHEWIPRLVEAVPPGQIRSVSLRRPGLAEVFLELTGHTLSGDRP